MGTRATSIEKLLEKNEKDDLFTIHQYKESEIVRVGTENENSILFMMNGRIQLRDFHGESKIFKSNRMYFISKNYAPYEGIVFKSATYIEMNTENLLPYVEQVLLNKIVFKYTPNTSNIYELEIKKTLSYFLAEILYYKKHGLTSKYLFDIKRKEFLFIVRTLYQKEVLACFFSPTVLNQNEFRMSVFANYTNSISTTVKDLAAKCNMTTKTFTRKFKTEFDMNPHVWIIQQKVKSLDYSLVYETLSTSEILDKYNFASESELLIFCKKHNLRFNLLDSVTPFRT